MRDAGWNLVAVSRIEHTCWLTLDRQLEAPFDGSHEARRLRRLRVKEPSSAWANCLLRVFPILQAFSSLLTELRGRKPRVVSQRTMLGARRLRAVTPALRISVDPCRAFKLLRGTASRMSAYRAINTPCTNHRYGGRMWLSSSVDNRLGTDPIADLAGTATSREYRREAGRLDETA